MGAPLFEEAQDMLEIAKELIEKRQDIFKGIDPELIYCAVRIDKPAPASQKKVVQIKGIRGPLTVLTGKRYLIYGYSSQWDKVSREKKYAHMANMLIRIHLPTEAELLKLAEKGEDFEYGKTKSPNLSDFKGFIKAVGVDWDEDNSEVPNIIEQKELIF